MGHAVSATQLTTRQQTIKPVALPPSTPQIAPSNVPAYQTYGYSAWEIGAGEDAGRRFDLMPDDYAGAPNAARLLSFFSMSDIHITDKESPAQGLAYGWLAPFGAGGMSSAYSPVILSSTHMLDAAIKAVNTLHSQTPFDCGLFLGDAINNSQYNELRWYIDVIDGNPITPSSGAHVGTNTIGYQKSYQAAGLAPSIPWYQVIGNHDKFWSGINFINEKLTSALVGSNILNIGTNPYDPDTVNKTGLYMGAVDGSTPYGQVINAGPTNNFPTTPTVAADASRHSLATTNSASLNWMSEFFDTTSSPAGHGFTQTNLDNDSACYTFEPKTNLPIKIIVFDNNARSNIPSAGLPYYAAAEIDQTRYTWLTNELQKGQNEDQLMILACHAPIYPQRDLFDTNRVSLCSVYSSVSDTQMISTLHGYPNLIMLIAGHRHLNTVTPHPSPDPAHPENGFWEVETASLRDFPQQFRSFDIRRNSDNTISILTTSVDPQVEEGTPAGDSRGYAIGAARVFGGTNTFADTTSHAYNAELVKSLTPAMQTKIAMYGRAAFTNTIAYMTSYITNQMAVQGVKGLSLALVESNEIVWSQGFGLAVVESNVAATANSVYRIGSVSKVFTTACLLKLWEQGLVDLEASVTNYIPEYAVLPRFAGDRPPTLRECVNHHSGLPGDLFRNGFATAPWAGYNEWLLNELATDYPNQPVALHAVYCNAGFQLAEEVIERVSGMSLNDYAQTHVFGPLGMASSSYLKDKPNIAAHRTRAYIGDLAMPEEFVNIRGTGGMYSSVEDIAAWIRLILAEGHFNGTNILATNTVTAMLADQTTNFPMDVSGGFRVGLGWDSVADPKLDYAGRLCEKDGQTFTYYSCLIVLRDRQLGVIVMNNTPGTLPEDVARETLKQAVLERDGLSQPTNFSPTATAATNWSEETIGAMTGLYVTVDGLGAGYDRLEKAADGTLTWTVKAHDESSTSVFTGLTPHADGWLYSSNVLYPRAQPTNVAGYAVLFAQTSEPYGPETYYWGDRYEPPPIPAAWSSRLNAAWFPVDMPPTDLYWTFAQLGTDLSLTLTNRQGLLWMTSPSGSFVVAPSNEVLGFAPGHTVRRGASVVISETNGVEELRFSSYTYRRMDAFPVLPEGVTTNGTLPADRIQWFAFNAVSGVYYGVTLSNQSASARLKIGSSGWSAEDRGWTCSSNGSYLLGLSSTSATPYSLRLYTFTNTIAQMTQWMGEQMTNNGVVGATIAFVNGQDVVWMRGFGEADRAQHIPVAPDTVFRIASISKTFAACSVMQLAEHGLINLDAPLANYVTNFSILQRYGTNIITVRTVLDQHSGLPCDIGNGYETFEPYTNYMDGLIAGLHDDYAPLPTNTMWHYSNTGFALLTRLIEQASGLSLSSYSQSNLFLPMGMTNASFFHDNPWYEDHLSLGYDTAGEPVGEEYHNAYTAGSIYASAQDMAQYIRMILGQGQGAQGHVLDPATVDAMLTSQTAGLPLDVIPMNNWGLGWGVRYPTLDYAGRLCFHDGELTLSFCSILGILRDLNVGVFISFNTATGGSVIHPAVARCLQLAAEDKSGLLPPALPQPVFSPVTNLPSAELDAVTGLYVSATGYDLIRRCPTNAYQLEWVVNAQVETSVVPLVARVNGRFSDPATQTVELAFTNASGRDICVKYQYTDLFGHMPSVYAPRFEPVPIPAAWSNRIGEHWIVNLASQDIVRVLIPLPLNAVLWQQDGLLMFYSLGAVSVLQPENDNLAFIAGLGRNQGVAVRMDSSAGEESLWHQNYRYTYAPPQLTMPGLSNRAFQLSIANLRAGTTNQIERTTNLLSDSVWDPCYQFTPATSGGETNWQEPLSTTNAALYYRVIGL